MASEVEVARQVVIDALESDDYCGGVDCGKPSDLVDRFAAAVLAEAAERVRERGANTFGYDDAFDIAANHIDPDRK